MFCPKCGTENPDAGKFCRSCGTNLSHVPAALNPNLPQVPVNYDRRQLKKLKKQQEIVLSNNPDELWGHGIQKIFGGLGFVAISIVLLVTNMFGGHGWWWVMLFPAFTAISAGAASMAKARRLEKRMINPLPASNQQSLPNPQSNVNLPPIQTQYVKPQKSIYDTGELPDVPASVTEGTTRHLEINKEGETITLPKIK